MVKCFERMPPASLAASLVAVLALGAGCSSSSPATGPGDADAEHKDATAEAAPPVDAGPCKPASTAGFKPAKVTPVVQPACSDAQIMAFIGECYSSDATEETCSTWLASPSNFLCRANCLITEYGETPAIPGATPPPKPQPSWGPIVAVVNQGETDLLNVGACLAVADPTSSACANALMDELQCEYDACAAVPGCSVPTEPTLPKVKSTQMALEACFTSAGQGSCASYATTMKAACAGASTGPGKFCFSAATDDTSLTKMLTQQCGGGDGGGRYGG
jgi:hypothetical protein